MNIEYLIASPNNWICSIIFYGRILYSNNRIIDQESVWRVEWIYGKCSDLKKDQMK